MAKVSRNFVIHRCHEIRWSSLSVRTHFWPLQKVCWEIRICHLLIPSNEIHLHVCGNKFRRFGRYFVIYRCQQVKWTCLSVLTLLEPLAKVSRNFVIHRCHEIRWSCLSVRTLFWPLPKVCWEIRICHLFIPSNEIHLYLCLNTFRCFARDFAIYRYLEVRGSHLSMGTLLEKVIWESRFCHLYQICQLTAAVENKEYRPYC